MTTNKQFFKNKKVLITGGLGFIGSNLAKRLVELNSQITVVDSLISDYGGNLQNIAEIKDKITVNIADVRDSHSMKYLVQGQDILFNLAGQTSHMDSMKNPYADLDINAKAQLFILEACKDHNPQIKIVFASTRQLYGKPQYLPVDENHPIVPVDVNGINKLAGEWYHLLYNNVYGIKTCVLRLTNTYGPGMRVKDARQTFLGIWVKNLIDGVPIKVFGDGKQLRDFNYVDDVVEAFIVAAQSEGGVGKIYNLGHSEYMGLKDLAELMVKVNGSGSFELVPFPGELKKIDIGDYYSDFTKIKTELGWKPKILLEEGLKRSLDYYKINKDFYWTNAG